MYFKVMLIFNKDVVLQSASSLHLEVEVVYKFHYRLKFHYEVPSCMSLIYVAP
jgi:hypothetical protein